MTRHMEELTREESQYLELQDFISEMIDRIVKKFETLESELYEVRREVAALSSRTEVINERLERLAANQKKLSTELLEPLD